jgi:hypothetical protein
LKLLRNINFGSVVRNISIDFGGRSVDLWRLLEVLATADRVASVHIRYGDLDPWEIAGANVVFDLCPQFGRPASFVSLAQTIA